MGSIIKSVFLIAFLLISSNSFSWDRTKSIGGPALESTAIFQVNSILKGAIANPKMTTTQRNGISTPSEGLGVWDITTNKSSAYDGSNWIYHVFETRTQTLTNKTIAAGSNTISGLAHGTEVDNPSSGVHGVAGSILGTSDSQVVTNKDIDGGTASNALRITVPKNTKANLDSLSRKEGTIFFGSDTKSLYFDNGTVAVLLSASGTGGIPELVSTKTTDYPITDGDGITVVLVNDTSPDVDITLPTAANNTNRRIGIKNISTDKGKVTVVGTIDNETNIDLDFKNAFIVVQSDGTNWFIVAQNLTGMHKQYTLTVTGTNWTTTNAIGVPSRTLGGTWRIDFNIKGSLSVAASVFTINPSGLDWSHVGSQAVTTYQESASLRYTGISRATTTNDINIHVSTSSTQYIVTGNVELNAKPTFVE